MIINIRGTSGSGKSTLVRKLMSCYDQKVAYKEEGRRQPIGYVLSRPSGRSLAVIGHYETTCGGCDTISKMEHIFELVKKSASLGMDVVFEGLLISADVNRTVELWKWVEDYGGPSDGSMLVVALDVPLQVCLDSVNARRHARNPDLPPVNPRNTESKHKGVQQSMRRLEAAGVPAVSLDRDAALARIKAELGL